MLDVASCEGKSHRRVSSPVIAVYQITNLQIILIRLPTSVSAIAAYIVNCINLVFNSNISNAELRSYVKV